ncbi:MAG: T9SS type A sorting domain-containing protein [Rhodothermales bacterium]|nr:T9SS type A sorting domain-containing protein [Rhodothermales bacterium]
MLSLDVPSPIFAEPIDLDSDRDLDLIVYSSSRAGSGKLFRMDNLGGASFSAPVVIEPEAGDISDFETADMDDDGDEDIVVAREDIDQILWYANLLPQAVPVEELDGEFHTQTMLTARYPNPVQRDLRLSISVVRAGKFKVDISDALGRVVDVLYDQWLPQGEHQFVSDLSGWPAGLYFVRLTTDRSQTTMSVLKQ